MSTFLITGSNRGIGLELCKQIFERGDEVIATCREASSELKNLGVRIEEDIDISSEDSINNLRQALSGVELDCLIHNAGIYEFNSIDNFDHESIIRQFVVNALSPLSMTRALKGLLKRIQRLVSSGVEWDPLVIIHPVVPMVIGCLKWLYPWQRNHFQEIC